MIRFPDKLRPSHLLDWCRAHEGFFAVNVARALAVVFIVVGFICLVKTFLPS